ncbi:unnamed protein product [Ilex paraguariensis]|uniref:Uncharacterized protein n=1 Tax=Ilex paraguariensis TaxID=185542 RepID=A0ABC8RWS8_9AQUA
MRESVRRQSPFRESASESDSGYTIPMKKKIVTESRKNSRPEGVVKNGLFVSSSDQKVESSKKSSTVSDINGVRGKEVRSSRIYIRFKKTKPDEAVEDGGKVIEVVQDEEKIDEVRDEGKTIGAEGEVEEPMPKTWNLRPRKPICKPLNINGGTSKFGGSSVQENKAQLHQVNSDRLESEGNGSEKKEKKQKFSISLSREEIEEDIFILTGSKPARRPKKRARNAQKAVDNVLPGMWLASVTPDSYKVENPSKV